MSRRRVLALAALAAALLLAPIFLAPGTPLRDRGAEMVYVTNFPDLQTVDGAVSIQGTVRRGSLVRMREILVSPVARSETARLIDGGSLDTDGFTSVVLSLNGHIKGEVVHPGRVGAVLLPDEESIVKVLEEESLYQFPMEVVAASVGGEGAYFSSGQVRSLIAFPRYRLYLYNTTDKAVTVNLFAYLTN